MTELETEGEDIRMILPITKMAFMVNNQDEQEHSQLGTRVPSGFDLTISFEMSSEITRIQCHTHSVSSIIQGKKAQMTFKNKTFNQNGNEMVLLIGLSKPHESSVVIETSSENSISKRGNKDVVMLSFFPNFENIDEDPHTELVFLVDQSGSMSGARIIQVKAALQLFLRSISLVFLLCCYFNLTFSSTKLLRLVNWNEIQYHRIWHNISETLSYFS